MTDVWRLDTLPSDVLILIFDYCHAFDLVRLSEVCTRFHEVIRDKILWVKKSKQTLVTNQTSKQFRARCNPLLCLRTKWQISHNWQYGKYTKKIIFSQGKKLMPWLQLTDDTLWWSGGDQLFGFKRKDPFSYNDVAFAQRYINSDICKFVVREDYVISGHRDGSLKFWSLANSGSLYYDGNGYHMDHLYYSIERAHSTDVNAVDETSQVVISGSGDGVVKIWMRPGDTMSNIPSASISVRDRILSLLADPTGQKFAVGSSGTGDGPPLHILDIESCTESNVMKHPWRRGAGILDMVWDNPQTLLTCGYDTYVRKWDMRTEKCVGYWPDPTDATMYCISSDYQYSMVTGAQFNCKAVLWDQRQTNYVQLYFMNLRRISSPVYSLCFDSSQLYGATDQHLVELKFSGRYNKETNYREILRYGWNNDENPRR
ncbi:F-box/WD repeat-containing protein 4-like [Belonocnema kinseyi]|uniref:F-box/WD repeat-containing protein 4-like n=1 Tax=Belonocnema kinseyi TaxID=2817044 RepID=UPI00143DFBAC|nr:F-box/WD repeat-containing protein 4-like [Belonocnema kinseyi]